MKRAMAVLTSRAAVGCAVVVALCSAATSTAGAVKTDLDGPGNYFLIRTYPATADPTAEQNAACDEHFDGIDPNLTVRQAALSYAPTVDRKSGMAVDETASYLRPGFICAGPGANSDLVQAYATAELPAATADAEGPCAASLPSLLKAAPFIACRLAVGSAPEVESPGGFAMGNSVSGSIFIGYLVRDSDKPLPYTPPGPEPERGSLPNDPDFYVWRAFNTTLGSCANGIARSVSLSATQPNLQTGLLDPAEALTKVGTLSLCVGEPTRDRRLVTGTARIARAGGTANLTAQGDCREAPVPEHADLLMQTCSVTVQWADTPLFRAGHFTSIGLVHADRPLVPANSHIWSLGLLDGHTEGGPLPVPAP